MITAEQIAPIRAVPLLRTEYHQLAKAGAYAGRRVQLIFGTVIDMSAMGTEHAQTIRALIRHFVTSAPAELDVMVQLPIAAADDSEPEPDFAFVPHESKGAADHPRVARLLVEVADTSLKLDLGPKAQLYAASKVPEYWVIDLNARTTVVYRTPRRGKYTSVRRVPWTALLRSTAVPSLSVRLTEHLER